MDLRVWILRDLQGSLIWGKRGFDVHKEQSNVWMAQLSQP